MYWKQKDFFKLIFKYKSYLLIIMGKIKFVYWKVAARAQAAMLMLHACEEDYNWDYETANKWPESKNDTPFKQLPVMYDENNNLIAQSGAITRYCAKIAKLLPNIPIQCAKTEMVMEQTNDIYDLMVKCKYAGDEEAQINAWREFKEKKLHEKLIPLNDMLTQEFFGGSIPDAGDICVFSIINLIVRAGIKDCLIDYKKLYDHYTRVYLTGSIKDYVKENPEVYFVYKEKSTEKNVLSNSM